MIISNSLISLLFFIIQSICNILIGQLLAKRHCFFFFIYKYTYFRIVYSRPSDEKGKREFKTGIRNSKNLTPKV